MSSTLTFDAYADAARQEGFDEVLERRWQPSTVIDTHSHAFALKALVVQGEMWLTVDGDTRHLLPGDTFAIGGDVPHAERYGDQAPPTGWRAATERR